jgi:ribosome-binding ATPase YchF (GTP1/OBG family)
VTVVSSEVLLVREISRNLDRTDHDLSAKEKDGENETVKEKMSVFKRTQQKMTNGKKKTNLAKMPHIREIYQDFYISFSSV